MSRHLYIAGVGRISDLEKGSLRIEQALTYQIDTCSFSIKGEQPTEGEEVIVEDDELGRLFAGIIEKVELGRTFPDKSIKVWNVDCDDYTALLDRRLVVETYENKPADWIFRDIAAKYCPGFTVNGVQSGAPLVEYIVFDYVHPSECFKELCNYVGWHWQPDYYKDLQFFSAEDLASPAPMILVPGGKFRFGKHSINTQGLRNRVYVRGGTMLSDPQTIQWKADGVARVWVLPWGPHEVSLQVGEGQKTVGVENLHEEADFDYMMNFQEKYIRCSAQTATPVAGTTMSLTAKQDIDVITMVEDLESQAAIAAVQGGDGVYEHVIVDDSLTTVQAAEAAGMADLREHANPRVKGSFETEYVGIKAPEWQTIIFRTAEILQGDYFEPGWKIGQTFAADAKMHGKNALKINFCGFWVGGEGEASYSGDAVYWHVYNTRGGVPEQSMGHVAVTSVNEPIDEDDEENWTEAVIPLNSELERGETYAIVLEIGVSYFIVFWGEESESSVWLSMTGNDWQESAGYVLQHEIKAFVYPVITWQPGQIVNINLPDRGVKGEYLIQRVSISPTWSNPSIWTYRVEYGGRLLGIADFLKALVSAQQKKKFGPGQNIHKMVYSQDTLGVQDELVTSTRALPYICGDVDAICGLVVVANG